MTLRYRPASDRTPTGLSARTLAVVVAAAAFSIGSPGAAAGLQDPLIAPPPAILPDALYGRDSVTVVPGQRYPAGALHRFLFGTLNRDLWDIAFKVPVLDFDSVAGGLEVTELSGGKQTLGLRLEGRNGRIYQFRSIVKTPERAIPSPLLRTPVDEVLQDQMAAQFPLAAMVVAEFLQKAGVLVAPPRPVVMPDDPRLGEYREAFAGRMGWLEVRPNEAEGDEPGFAGSSKVTGSEALFERLREEPGHYVDQRTLVRARLVDMLVHDWDRHMDQWRWASFEDPDGRTRWEPIPRDRDWALATIDGILPRLTSVYFPQYTGFNDGWTGVRHLTWSAQLVDRTLLTGLGRDAFLEEARALQQLYTDAFIDEAVGVLPRGYLDAVGDELKEGLRERRDQLDEIAAEFYAYMAEWVDVFGTEEDDVVRVTRQADGTTRVTLAVDGVAGPPRYDRTFTRDETREVRLYLLDGDDRVRVEGDGGTSVRVNIVPGHGDDRVEDATSGNGLGVYGHAGDDDFDLGDGAWVTDRFEGDEVIQDAYLYLNRRDWGVSVVPLPDFRYDSDQGVYVGAALTRYGYGFQYDPYRSRYGLRVLNGLAVDEWIAALEFERPLSNGKWRVWADAEGFTEYPTRFFGFGNESVKDGDTDAYVSDRTSITTRAGVRFRPDETWRFSIGPSFTAAGAVEPGTSTFDTLHPYGSRAFNQLGMVTEARWDRRDHPRFPRSGVVADASAKVYPALLDVVSTFGGGRLALRGYVPLGSFLDPVLHLRLTGEKAWGATPFEDLPYIGGSSSVPGFSRRRFLGTSAASGAAMLRAELFDIDRFSGVDFGVHGVVASGRVWYDGETSDVWHTSSGGGLWINIHELGRPLGVTVAGSGEGSRLYLDFGFLF